MKIAFLDFDGVILPFGKTSMADRKVSVAVGNLNSLLEKEKDLKIVISSTWRRHGLSYCKRFLKGLGIDSERVIGLTGVEQGERGNQIQAYLGRHPEVKQFVILDDDSDMGPLMNKLVKTRSLIGLTDKEVELAIEILNK